MTSRQAIADLDEEIADSGQPVTLVRQVANGDPVEHPARAFVRGYRAEEMTGEITVGSSLVVLSPSSLAGSPFADGIRRQTDSVVVSGADRKVIVADPVAIGEAVVRWNLTVI